MKNYIEIKSAFGDSYIQAFYYDIFGQKLELYYEGYYDINIKKYKEISCALVIKNWNKAYSIPYDIEKKNNKRYDIDDHMGVFFMIMSMKYDDAVDIFEITINMIDNSYCTYIFEQPDIYIIEKEKY